MAVKKNTTKAKKTSTAKKSDSSRGKKSSSSKNYLETSKKPTKNTKDNSTKGNKTRSSKGNDSKSKGTASKKGTGRQEIKITSNKNNNAINGEILAIITLVLGVFFAVAMHTSLTGMIGDFIGKFFRGMFGITGYLIPYIMIISAAMVFLKREKPFTKKHMICMTIIFFMVNLINSERYLSNFSFSTANPKIVYSMGNQLLGGGILGMYPGKVIESAIGPVGIYLFSFAIILIAVLIASDITLTEIFQSAKDKKEESRIKRDEKSNENSLDQSIDWSINQIKNRPSNGVDYISQGDIKRRQNMKEKLETNRRRHNILSLVKNELNGKETIVDDTLDPLLHVAEIDSETGEIVEDNTDFSSLRDVNQKLQINISGMDVNDEFHEENKIGNIKDINNKNEMDDLNTNDLSHLFDKEEIDVFDDFDNEPNKMDYIGNNLTDSRDLETEKNALNNLEGQQKARKKSESKEQRKEREKSEVEIQANIDNKKDQASRYEVEYKLPDLSLLNRPERKEKSDKDLEDLRNNAATLEKTLKSFNVDAKVINVTKGSSVTRYEVQPAVGTKVSSIVRLSDDIALNLRAKSIRMEAPIPGKAAVGIEIENESREMVTIGEMIGSEEFKHNNSKLSFVVGKDIAGKTVVADLAKMPHMLIAGATGSGKSVCINTIIASILYNANPNEVKLLLIDPKMVELGNYNGIPHLLIPVVTDSNKAAAALNWAVSEMTGRYKKFAENSVREIKGYNKLMKKIGKPEEVMSQIVIIIDELADLMMVASSLVEEAICRLAQLARAAGIHLIVATQRPSVDVVTGLIKANIPSRIAFMVSSQVDSRTIIDMTGAEKLVGNGDMLFKPQNLDKPIRVQGPFISDEEVENIIEFIKGQNLEVDYDQEVIKEIKNKDKDEKNVADSDDVLMEDAIRTVIKAKQASVSMLQRRFRIGYNRAARMVDDMEMAGIVGPQDGSRPRTVLVDESYFEKGNNSEDSQVNNEDEESIKEIGMED